jgi:hypothetical protein
VPDFLSTFPNFPSQDFPPALIMLRVALGRARSDTEWSSEISDVRFNTVPEAQERSRGATSTPLTTPRQHREEVDLEVNGEPLDTN